MQSKGVAQMANITISESILGKIKKPKGQVLDEMAAAVEKALGLDLREIEMDIKEAAAPKVRRKEMEGKWSLSIRIFPGNRKTVGWGFIFAG